MSRCYLAVETLEDRVLLSTLDGVLLSGIYLNPTLLTNAFEPPALESTTDLLALDQKYDLRVQVSDSLDWKNYWWNWGGVSEKWIQGGDGDWYYLLPQGKLYGWQSGDSPMQGTLLADVGDNRLDPDIQERLSALDQEYDFFATGNYHWNWGGLDEKWIRSSDGSWFYILPQGRIVQWDTGSKPLQGEVVADFSDDLQFVPDSKVYQFPTFLTSAESATPIENTSDSYALDQKYGFRAPSSFYANWGGLNEKWIKDAEDRWYCILPHGALYQWQGNADPLNGKLVALLDPSVHENPFALTDPTPPVADATAETLLLTSLNRSHVPDDSFAGQSGGYGPNLRYLFRASDGGLWFTGDMADSYYGNRGTRYFRQDPVSGEWRLMGETQFLPGVWGNAASLMKDDVIYSYAPVFGTATIQESFFSTSDPSLRGSRYIYVDSRPYPFAHYLGAAVSPSGTRVVWWTEYPANNIGSWVYMYDRGDGWQKPISTTLGDYTFSYEFVHFLSDTRLLLGGELYINSNTRKQAEMAELTLGQPLNLVAGLYSTQGENVHTVADVWVDPVTGGIHVLGETNGSNYGDDPIRTLPTRKLLYFYKPADEDWAGNNYELFEFDSSFRGRFLDSPDALAVVRGDTAGGGVRIRQVNKAQISGSIDWAAAPEFRAGDLPFGFVVADGIWVESANHQTEPVQGSGFVFTGHWPLQSNFLWYVDLA